MTDQTTSSITIPDLSQADLAQLERHCQVLYNPNPAQDPKELNEAHRLLLPLTDGTNNDNIAILFAALRQTLSPSVVLFASTALKKLLT